MSTLTNLVSPEAELCQQATEKLDALDITFTKLQAQQYYDRFLRLGNFDRNELERQDLTPPGVNGFNMALKSCLYLVGAEQQPLMRTHNRLDEIVEVFRPFNLIQPEKPDPKKSSASELEQTAVELARARAQQRGYRLGLFLLSHTSPLIEYFDTYVPLGSDRVIAAHVDSNRILLGRRVTPEQAEQVDLGYCGAYPDGAKSVYSYIISETV